MDVSFKLSGTDATNLRMSYYEEPWYKSVERYMHFRYYAIEERMIRTFDYVTPENSNRKTHSFVYASILRDVGSVFDSTVRDIMNNANPGKYENKIHGYLKFLESHDPDFWKLSIFFDPSFAYIFPFQKGENGLPNWWNAYNDVKHHESSSLQQGNLENTLTGLAGLKILHETVCYEIDSEIFSGIEVLEDIPNEKLLFPVYARKSE